MQGLSAKASDKRPESLFKPSAPCTLVKSNGKRDRERDLLQLSHVELIGMTVENKGSYIHHMPCKISTRKSRQQTMVSTSAYRPISSKRTNRGQRSFQNTGAPAKINPHGKDRPVRDTIPRKSAGHDAGVVLKACFRKGIKSPERTPDNRKIRGTISFHLLPGNLFQKVFGTTYVG